MDALSVITLEQAKEFLVVDFPDRDAEITRHIKSAIGFVEQYTNIMMYERPRDYGMSKCSLEIYDAPITFTDASKFKLDYQALSVIVNGKSNSIVSTTVGYSDVNDIPQPLIEAAYKIITYLYENKDIYSAGLPWDIQMMLNKYRRCIV